MNLVSQFSAPIHSTGIFYIDFGSEASEFGPFVPGTYYMAPKNILVKNYLIIWNQSDSSNQNHPMRFSTTPDGPLNQSSPGTILYTVVDHLQHPLRIMKMSIRLFLMNEDETNRIYYHCAIHNYMSGYTGDEGYMILDTSTDDDDDVNEHILHRIFINLVIHQPLIENM